MTSDVKLPVRVFLPVHLKQRGNKFKVSWWRCDVQKQEYFSEQDLVPFELRSECEETGYYRRFQFQLLNIERVCRVAHLQPYEIANSKSWPLERALLALGWERCLEPTLSFRKNGP